MGVFALFSTKPYTFIKVRSNGAGNFVSEQEWQADGIVKFRDGKSMTGNAEALLITTTLHIRPEEPFVDDLVGNFVRIDGKEYRIESATTGIDFDTGEVEFHRATIEKASLWVSDLPVS